MSLTIELTRGLTRDLPGYLTGVASSSGRAGYMTWANFNSELVASANAEGHNGNDTLFNAFTDYIFFDAAAFNLADGAALDTALTNETMALADLDTYAAAYTP